MRSEQEAPPAAPAVARHAARIFPEPAPRGFARGPRPAPPRTDSVPRIVVVRSLDELIAHRQALDDLAADALETNVFYESILAEAAVRSFGAGRRLEFILVYRSDPGAPLRSARLDGFFPFERAGRARGLSVRALVAFQRA